MSRIYWLFIFVELKKGFSVPLDELNLLKDLYQQTHGEDWLWRPQIFGPKWNFDIPSPNPCNTNGSTWQGITCSKLPTFCSSSTSPSCSVTSLSLELYGLKGKLPYIWTEMTSLTRIALPRNRLNNSLPKELPHSLISLDLESNLLSGPIPSEYGLLTSLTSLAVERNRLRGTIPSSLGDLINLSSLTFGYNLLSQTIPPELGQLSNLKYLTMTLCQLTGPFPSSFGSLASLDTLDISFNSFTNSIPSTLGDMLALTSMVLDYNFFSRSIPSELTQLTGLAHLSLATNFFSGQIYLLNDNFFQLSMISLGYNLFTGPFPSFTSSPLLAKINVDTNTLSSTISSELGMLTLLNIFTLNNNQFTGPIPSSFGSLLLVTQFDLSFNHLTGTIPTAFGSMESIADLQVRNNLLTGSIPSELGKLLTAQSLVLTRNLFTSTLPCTIQNLTRLSVLTCDNNYLTGICPDLILPVSLEILDFSFNYISGSIPDQLISPLQNLLTFDVNENFFSGHLPDLSSLSIVKRINLASNHLSGLIPSFIASLSQLRQLNLGSNFFSGTLKNWLWQASNLTLVNVDLSANHLEGEISNEIFFLPFLQTLALTSNCFQGTLPESICSAEDLLVLSMDGLGSSSGCSDLITLPWSDVSLNAKKISGQIPKCLWAMNNLTTVSLSSNGLTGTLSDLLTSSLINLTLSHNHLSGTIPMSLQQHPFQSLDLSYNKFTGEYNIISFLNLQNASCRLVLEVNRLSGHFPSPPLDSSMMNLYMNVLTGNIFSCVDVPDSDAYSNSYRCGSRSIDEAMIGISIVIFVASLLFVIFIITQFVSLTWIQSFVTPLFAHCHTLSSYLHPFDPKISSWDESSEELLSLSKAMKRFLEFNYFIVILFLSGIMTTLPLYLIRIGNDDNYSTHSHLYRWEWTTAYLSGVLPSTLLLSAWILVVCTFLYCVKRFLWGVLSFQLLSPSFQTRVQCSQHSSSHLLTSSLWMSFSNDLLLLLVNIAVMGTINALYIIATNQQFSPALILLIQVSMALFKAFWNKFCLPILDFSKQSHRLRIFVLVLNSIFIPCIVTALTSPACFQELIKKPEDIVSFYYYVSCNIYLVVDGNFQCLTQQTLRVDVPPFTPSFTYNYLCGSTLLSSYLPIYFYLSLFQIITTPLSSYLLSQHLSYSALPVPVRSSLPGLLWPHHWTDQSVTRKEVGVSSLMNLEQNKKDSLVSFVEKEIPSPSLLFKVDSFANKFMHDVLVLLTFGLCCPLLCFAISLSMILSIFEVNIMVGRFILSKGRMSLESCGNQHSSLLTLSSPEENNPSVAPLLSFDPSFRLVVTLIHDLAPACRNLVWIVIWSSCFFFMFLCWDIAGDELGLERSLWVPTVVLGITIIFYFYFFLFPLSQSQREEKKMKEEEEEEVISSLHRTPLSLSRDATPRSCNTTISPLPEIEIGKSIER